jgi:predicted DNA-binding protein (MmcQ/YjbR family)
MAYPVRKNTRESLVYQKRVRKLSMALPGVQEVQAWGEPTFRWKNRMFAMFASPGTRHGDGRTAVWIKTPAEYRDMLVSKFPKRYFNPPYMAADGWVGAYLDEHTDWQEIEDLIVDGHRLLGVKKPKSK